MFCFNINLICLLRYMMPALLPFYSSRAANILRYRYNSLDESNKIARVFGYNGSMFAWTAYVLIAENNN